MRREGTCYRPARNPTASAMIAGPTFSSSARSAMVRATRIKRWAARAESANWSTALERMRLASGVAATSSSSEATGIAAL